MEKTTVETGFILKDFIQYDDHSVVFYHKKFQWPFSFAPFKWIGFIGEEEGTEINFDENLHYYVNTGKLFGRKTLYLSHSGRYETLPTTEEELSSDDKDDFTMLQLNDKTEEDSSPFHGLSEVGTVVPSRKEIDENDEDLYMMTETIQLRIGTEHIEQILSYLNASPAHELTTAKVGSIININQELLAYNDEWAFHVKPHCFSDSEIDSTPIQHMAFFLEQKPFIIGRNSIYCGYHRQIHIEGISRSIIDEFKDWCRARAPRLTAEGENYKSCIIGNPLNLWRYLNPDNLSITDDALIYIRKTFRRHEMIYLPFKRISLFVHKNGKLSATFEVFGEQNIIPKFSFSESDVSAIKEAMEKHLVKIGNGRSWHSTYLYPENWFGRAPRIMEVDNKLAFYPKRIESEMKQYSGMKTRFGVLEQMEISNVTWHKPIFGLFGTIEIEGTPVNIRKDQNTESVTMIVPDLSTFCYKFLIFSGSLRDFLKESNADFNRKYKKFRF